MDRGFSKPPAKLYLLDITWQCDPTEHLGARIVGSAPHQLLGPPDNSE
jgi:hypothetical protein